MWANFVTDFRKHKTSTIVMAITGTLLLLLYISLFPSLQKQAQSFSELLSHYPQGFIKAFGINTDFFGKIENYLAGEQFSITWQALVSVLVIGRAGVAIAGEVERGTMNFLLAQPVSRGRLYFGKYLSGLAALVIFIIFSTLAAMPLANLFSVHYSVVGFFDLALICLAFGWAIFAASFLVSALSSERSRVYIWIGGTILFMYVVDIVSKLKESLSDLRYASAFHYLDINAFFIAHQINWADLAVFGAVIVIGTVGGWFIFNRRDI